MTLPLDPSTPVGNTEMSWGPGLFPHPNSNFQAGRTPFPEVDDIRDNFRTAVADRRSDSTDPEGVVGEDLLFVEGNPDRYGGQPKIVREAEQRVPVRFPENDIKTGVTREG